MIKKLLRDIFYKKVTKGFITNQNTIHGNLKSGWSDFTLKKTDEKLSTVKSMQILLKKLYLGR